MWRTGILLVMLAGCRPRLVSITPPVPGGPVAPDWTVAGVLDDYRANEERAEVQCSGRRVMLAGTPERIGDGYVLLAHEPWEVRAIPERERDLVVYRVGQRGRWRCVCRGLSGGRIIFDGCE